MPLSVWLTFQLFTDEWGQKTALLGYWEVMYQDHTYLVSFSPHCECRIEAISSWKTPPAQDNPSWLGWDPICAIHLIKKLKSPLDAEWVHLSSFSWTLVSFIILNGKIVVDCTQLLTISHTERHLAFEKSWMDCSGWHNFLLATFVPEQSVLTFQHTWKYFSTKLPPQLTLSLVLSIPLRLVGLYLQRSLLSKKLYSCLKEENSLTFFLDFWIAKTSKGTFKLRHK